MTVDDLTADSPVIIEDKTDAYKRLVDIAKVALAERDAQYWILGQCALVFETHYGDQTLARFADEVGVEPNRLYEYRMMTEFYDAEARERLQPLKLTYSHMREARRLGDIDTASEFLHSVAMNLWTVRQTRQRVDIMLGKAPQISMSQEDRAAIYTPPMLRNFHPTFEIIATITEVDGKMVFDAPLPPDYEKGQRFRVMFEPIED